MEHYITVGEVVTFVLIGGGIVAIIAIFLFVLSIFANAFKD